MYSPYATASNQQSYLLGAGTSRNNRYQSNNDYYDYYDYGGGNNNNYNPQQNFRQPSQQQRFLKNKIELKGVWHRIIWTFIIANQPLQDFMKNHMRCKQT